MDLFFKMGYRDSWLSTVSRCGLSQALKSESKLFLITDFGFLITKSARIEANLAKVQEKAWEKVFTFIFSKFLTKCIWRYTMMCSTAYPGFS
jgi:hypothetical protein